MGEKMKPSFAHHGFCKRENSGYLLQAAPNLICSCIVIFFFIFIFFFFSFKKKHGYLNCGIHAFVLFSATQEDLAELFVLEAICISLSAPTWIVKCFSLHATHHAHATPTAPLICFAQAFPPGHLSVSTSHLFSLPIHIFTGCPN